MKETMSEVGDRKCEASLKKISASDIRRQASGVSYDRSSTS